MKLLHFTDIHLTTPGQTIAGRDPNTNFQRALDHALDLHSDAEAVFITGDLSDWGEEPDYRRLDEIIAKVSIPVHLGIGNHDDRATLLGVFPDLADENGFVQKVIPLSDGHAVVIDTWGPDTHAGHFCETRAAWLSAQLSQLEGPVLIFMHHNPVPVGIDPVDQIMLMDADRLRQTLRPFKDRIAHIFHGHCHLHLNGTFEGIPFSAPRGTNHAGWPNFGETAKLSSSDLTEAYSVILTDGPDTMIHMVEFGYQGEIRTEGSPNYADWDRKMVR